eukprot:scaffold9142_cov39-Cylindrotheca_fusiformis.AAC.1
MWSKTYFFLVDHCPRVKNETAQPLCAFFSRGSSLKEALRYGHGHVCVANVRAQRIAVAVPTTRARVSSNEVRGLRDNPVHQRWPSELLQNVYVRARICARKQDAVQIHQVRPRPD